MVRGDTFSLESSPDYHFILNNQIIVAFQDGAPTLLGDVARVEDGLEDERTYAELGGVPGVSLELRRQSGENTVEVAERCQTVDFVARLLVYDPKGRPGPL